ncbi:bax inhibitor 1 [Diaphorina citri]|uniref:Bax inhibitor 1 n=1 Tax=Diaphorina citri TaxID=121845 RepID=A0A1S4EB21_DIACI|nr:bax inhibitor 1 [Diaphorina citri]KAI5720926.1 hypothetical protein M8J77_013270 [Diaphorina citri]
MAQVGAAFGVVSSVFKNFNKAFRTKVDSSTKQHLQNVYGCLTLGMLAATAGAYLQLTQAMFQSTLVMLLSSVGAFGFLIYVMSTKNQINSNRNRTGAFIGFTLCTGIGLGPLLEMAIVVNPSIVVTAFMLTTLLFVSFTLAAIFAREGQWIYIGGSLMTMLSTLITLSLANLFFGSKLLFDVTLYLGLVIMCGFILYDTQLILEKVKQGDKDHVSHCIDLFIDFIGVFRRVLIILHSKEVEEKKKSNKSQE